MNMYVHFMCSGQMNLCSNVSTRWTLDANKIVVTDPIIAGVDDNNH